MDFIIGAFMGPKSATEVAQGFVGMSGNVQEQFVTKYNKDCLEYYEIVKKIK